ncbi:hypothetical protein KSP39_PZI007433 [Platanthera zijinensis]|uniref:Uncharacterized protein n=1 Tax=Platanthera zijinensis TaxID=2320716 RepID=A0AAP0BSJ4_9ASPA
MFPFVKETVEVVVERFIVDGFAKEGVNEIPFLQLILELEERVAELEQADKGKVVADEEDDEEVGPAEDEVPDDAASIQQQGSQSAQFSSSSSSEESKWQTESADSKSLDSGSSDSDGYSP